MFGDEDEVSEEPSELTVPRFENAASGESVEMVVAVPIATVPGAAAVEKQPLAYWQAVISALSPQKQAAAWQFFQERELGQAKGATDTLSGLVLLLEANGLFMDACAKRLADTAAMPVLRGEPRGEGEFLPALGNVNAGVTSLEPRLVDQPAVDAAAPPSANPTRPSAPSNQIPASSKAPVSLKRTSTIWCFAVLLILGAGGIGAWLGAMYAKATADLQVKAQVQQIRTWLDVDEQARAILMSRKAELAFGFARDPSLGNRKVYTLTIKGVSILRAGKTKEGAGIIAFDSGGPDLIP